MRVLDALRKKRRLMSFVVQAFFANFQALSADPVANPALSRTLTGFMAHRAA